jgi:hypothetical protein
VAAGAFGFLIFSMPSLARTHMAAGRSFVVVHSTMRASLLGGSHFLTLGVDHFFLGLFFFAVRLFFAFRFLAM